MIKRAFASHLTFWTLPFILLVGCAHDPERSWFPRSLEELGIVAIVASGNKPSVRKLSIVKDYEAGMTAGALSGLFLYTSPAPEESKPEPPESEPSCKSDNGVGSYVGCVVVSATIGVGMSLAGMLASVGLGALWGAGATATDHGPQPPAAVEAQATMQAAAEFPDPQLAMAEHLKNLFTATFGLRPAIYADKEYVTAYGPEVRAHMGGVATFLFTEIESVELQKAGTDSDPDLNLLIRVSAKTFRGKDETPSDTHRYEWKGLPHPLAAWGSQETDLLRRELYQAYEDLSAQIVTRLGERLAPQASNATPPL